MTSHDTLFTNLINIYNKYIPHSVNHEFKNIRIEILHITLQIYRNLLLYNNWSINNGDYHYSYRRVTAGNTIFNKGRWMLPYTHDHNTTYYDQSLWTPIKPLIELIEEHEDWLYNIEIDKPSTLSKLSKIESISLIIDYLNKVIKWYSI